LEFNKWGIISLMDGVVQCNANAITEYDRRRSGLPNAALYMKPDNDSIEQ